MIEAPDVEVTCDCCGRPSRLECEVQCSIPLQFEVADVSTIGWFTINDRHICPKCEPDYRRDHE